jgi:fructoselysine 6-kinase
MRTFSITGRGGDQMAAQIVTVGDNVVDCYPDLGVMYPGGNTVNVAVHLSRLGISAAYVGAIGTDEAGDVVSQALAYERVDCSRLRRVHGPNARAYVRLDGGNRVFIGADPGVSVFTISVGDRQWLEGAALIHTGECSSLEPQLAELHDLPALLSYDFSIRPWDYVEKCAPYVDVAILSFDADCAATPEDLARRVQALGPRVVAVTIGSLGAVVADGTQTVVAPAPQMDVVDTLGAGDAFIARLLSGIVRGESLGQLAAASTAYASETCMYYGAFGHEASLSPENPQMSEWQKATSDSQIGITSSRESG